MKQIIIAEKSAETAAPTPAKKEFQGYTMEELRYQRALAALRKEFCKSNVTQAIVNLRKPSENTSKFTKALPFISKITDTVSAVSGKVTAVRTTGNIVKVVANTLVGRLKPLDYVMLGISLIGPTRKVLKHFRKKKK